MKHYLERTADVLNAHGSGPAGLSPSAAAERLAAHGPNALEEAKKKTLLQRICEQIRDPMVLVLVAAARRRRTSVLVRSHSFGTCALNSTTPA